MKKGFIFSTKYFAHKNIEYKDNSAKTRDYSLKILHYVVDDARLKTMTYFQLIFYSWFDRENKIVVDKQA